MNVLSRFLRYRRYLNALLITELNEHGAPDDARFDELRR